jgi:hypothetical protein
MECGCRIRESVGSEDVQAEIVRKGGVEVQRMDLVQIVTRTWEEILKET